MKVIRGIKYILAIIVQVPIVIAIFWAANTVAKPEDRFPEWVMMAVCQANMLILTMHFLRKVKPKNKKEEVI